MVHAQALDASHNLGEAVDAEASSLLLFSLSFTHAESRQRVAIDVSSDAPLRLLARDPSEGPGQVAGERHLVENVVV